MDGISGDSRVFAVINTTEYNNDGKWCIQSANGYGDLKEIGFTNDDWSRITDLSVGEMTDEFDFKGVIVIRIA